MCIIFTERASKLDSLNFQYDALQPPLKESDLIPEKIFLDTYITYKQ